MPMVLMRSQRFVAGHSAVFGGGFTAIRNAVVLGCTMLWAAAVPVCAFAEGASSRQVLESFPVNAMPGPNGQPIYELSLAPCQNASCPFEVRLLSGRGEAKLGRAKDGKAASVLDSIALDWPANEAPAQPAPGAAPRVWSTGEEEGNVTVSARTIPLEPGKADDAQALLITQTAGFDHPKRRHVLYVASSGLLKTAWFRSEPQGPYVSRVVVAMRGAPVHLSLFFSSSDDVADKVSAQRLEWNARQQVFAEKPAAAALQAVVAGTYATLREARAVRAASACIAEYGVVDTWPGRGLVRHRYALVALAVEPAQAAMEAARLSQCQPDLRARVHPLGQLSPRSFQPHQRTP